MSFQKPTVTQIAIASIASIVTAIAIILAVSGFGTSAVQKVETVVSSVSADTLADNQAKIAELEGKLQVIRERETSDARLGQFTINMMYKSSQTIKELSPAMMQILARNIARDTGDVMANESMMKQFFVGAVQLESQFLRFSQSPTGPKGLSQTTKSTFHAALKFCGMNDVHDNDVWDADLSIIAGACYFKWLYLSYRDGYYTDSKGQKTNLKICPEIPEQPVLKEVCAGQHASVAYNQGENSRAIKSFIKNGLIEELEPAIYNGKVVFNVTTTSDQKMPGIPAINELPRPKPASQITLQK